MLGCGGSFDGTGIVAHVIRGILRSKVRGAGDLLTIILVVIAVVVGVLVLSNRLTVGQRDAAKHFMALLLTDWIVQRVGDAIDEETSPDLETILRTAPDAAMMRVELLVLALAENGGIFVANFRTAMPPVMRTLRYEFMSDRRDIPDDRQFLRKIVDYQQHVKQRVIEHANAGHYLIGSDPVLRVVESISDNIDDAKEKCS